MRAANGLLDLQAQNYVERAREFQRRAAEAVARGEEIPRVEEAVPEHLVPLLVKATREADDVVFLQEAQLHRLEILEAALEAAPVDDVLRVLNGGPVFGPPGLGGSSPEDEGDDADEREVDGDEAA